MKTLLVGITGGMGAGKSALSRIFSSEGYTVLSADEIARGVVAPGSPGLQQVVAEFGAEALLPDGSLNRSWMRSVIARDPSLRLKLEAITHPLIQARSWALAQEHFSRGEQVVFYEAPLLFEARSERRMDKVICVHAPLEVRVDRVMARDGRSRAEVDALMSSQMPQEEKMQRSDFLVENAGTEEELRAEAERVLGELKRLL